MINVHFNTDNISAPERDGLVALLQALKFGASASGNPVVKPVTPAPEPEIAAVPSASAAVAPEPEAAAPSAPADPEPKPRRGRPRKDASAESAAAPEAETAVGPEAEGPVAKAPTADELRAALMTYTKAHDVNSGLELLKDFGCQRISEMADKPVSDQVEFIRLATKV